MENGWLCLSTITFFERPLLAFVGFYSHMCTYFNDFCVVRFRGFCGFLVGIVIEIIGFILSNETYFEHPLLLFLDFYLIC